MKRVMVAAVLIAACAVAGCEAETGTSDGSAGEESVGEPTTRAESADAAEAPADGAEAPTDEGESGAAVKPRQKDQSAPNRPAGTPAPAAKAGTAAAALSQLAVKGRAPKTGYDRDQFGSAWTDDVTVQGGHNGCDTRNDTLRRDLSGITLKPGSNGCTVLTGALQDPYSGSRVSFVRGPQSARVQIDHVVALSSAWQTGAQQISSDQRRNLANDPLNLLSARGDLNAQKSDGDAATWLPPKKSIRCAYVARQIAVKTRYQLWVTPPERDAMRRILRSCPDQALPSGTGTPQPTETSAPSTTQPAPPPRTVAPRTTQPKANPGVTYYKNCDAVRAAGAAPIHAGEPGYARHLDRNGDGTGCE